MLYNLSKKIIMLYNYEHLAVITSTWQLIILIIANICKITELYIKETPIHCIFEQLTKNEIKPQINLVLDIFK